MGWSLFSWLFGEKEESPAEPLVFGAELRCPYGTEHSFLIVQTDDMDINSLPEACVLDREESVNIMSFGNCTFALADCSMIMELEEQWENEEPQKMLSNGKEVITTKSTLLCKFCGGEIRAVTSGQDGVVAARIAEEIELIREMDKKYPGLKKILDDPYASLYLEEGMYLMALQFLDDCVQKRGKEIRIEDILTENSLEMRMIIQAIAHLVPSCDAEKPDLFVEVLTVRGYENGMSSGLDAHVINESMMEMLRKDCENMAKQVEAGGYYRFCEEHARGVAIASQLAFQFSLACLYSQNMKARQRGEVVEEEVKGVVKEVEVEGEGDTFTSLRDLMSPEEVAKYDEHWLKVAERISDEAIENQIKYIKSGGITKPGGGAFKPAKICATVDLNNRNVHIGYNGTNKFNPSIMEIHPDLQESINFTEDLARNTAGNEYAYKSSFEFWDVDNCAEVYSVNQALHDGASMDNIFINTKVYKTGAYAKPCRNCIITFAEAFFPKIG